MKLFIFILIFVLMGCNDNPPKIVVPEYKHYTMQDLQKDLDNIKRIEKQCPDLTLDAEAVAKPIRARFHKMYIEKRWNELPHGSVAAPEGTAFYSRQEDTPFTSDGYYKK